MLYIPGGEGRAKQLLKSIGNISAKGLLFCLKELFSFTLILNRCKIYKGPIQVRDYADAKIGCVSVVCHLLLSFATEMPKIKATTRGPQ